ncbi:MAG: hypothetical protein U5K77_03695 [Candidatus Saccharibacteria bacterium]|nr:hypothetical protein [Candidatus Saccharibacteria bacterium]
MTQIDRLSPETFTLDAQFTPEIPFKLLEEGSGMYHDFFERYHVHEKATPIAVTSGSKAAVWFGQNTDYIEVPSLVVITRDSLPIDDVFEYGSFKKWLFGFVKTEELATLDRQEKADYSADASTYEAPTWVVALDGLKDNISANKSV